MKPWQEWLVAVLILVVGTLVLMLVTQTGCGKGSIVWAAEPGAVEVPEGWYWEATPDTLVIPRGGTGSISFSLTLAPAVTSQIVYGWEAMDNWGIVQVLSGTRNVSVEPTPAINPTFRCDVPAGAVTESVVVTNPDGTEETRSPVILEGRLVVDGLPVLNAGDRVQVAVTWRAP